MSNKLIITAALTGAEVTRNQQPNLPITPDEIAADAYSCYKAGASIVHIHARNNDGTSTQDIAVYRSIIEKIKSKCDVIIQVSTGGEIGMTVEERIEPLNLIPEMATLTTGTVNFGENVFINSSVDIEKIASKIDENNIIPEFEIFEVGMINNALNLVQNKILNVKNPHFDFVMGVPGGIPATLENLMLMKNTIPQNSTWTVAGIGKAELPLAVHSILLGGHVRVGFEDNIYYKKGEIANSNAELVSRVAEFSKQLGREVASPDEARKILNIQK